MRNNDTILLENAYDKVIQEMSRERVNVGGNTAKVLNTTRLTNSFATTEEWEDAKIKASSEISENIKRLNSDPNDIVSARDVLNIIRNFKDSPPPKEGEEGQEGKVKSAKDRKAELIDRDSFLVGDDDMSYQEILELVLRLTTTPENDPSLVDIIIFFEIFLMLFQIEQHNLGPEKKIQKKVQMIVCIIFL